MQAERAGCVTGCPRGSQARSDGYGDATPEFQRYAEREFYSDTGADSQSYVGPESLQHDKRCAGEWAGGSTAEDRASIGVEVVIGSGICPLATVGCLKYLLRIKMPMHREERVLILREDGVKHVLQSS